MRSHPVSKIELRIAGLPEILDLRKAVLRAGMPDVSAEFPGDLDSRARHYGAFHQGRNIGCLSLIPSTHEGREAWQLRGMAIDRDFQGGGIGHRLLIFAREDMTHDQAAIWWCNARVSAVGFYQKHGWKIISEVYEIPPIGPHYKMAWERPPVTTTG